MAMTPEELRVLQRIETQLETMPFYVAEYVRSKKRAGLSPNLRPLPSIPTYPIGTAKKCSTKWNRAEDLQNSGRRLNSLKTTTNSFVNWRPFLHYFLWMA